MRSAAAAAAAEAAAEAEEKEEEGGIGMERGEVGSEAAAVDSARAMSLRPVMSPKIVRRCAAFVTASHTHQ